MLILFLVSMSALVFYIEPAGAEPTTIIVPDDYPTIQEAVNVAMSGDIVYVRAGTYYEEVLIEEKSISLIGESPSTTIIDGMFFRIPIEVRMAERVNITGFTLMHSGEQWRSNMIFESWPESGILLWNSDECDVSGNNITDNYYGLTVYSSWSGSWNNTVQGNFVTNNWGVGVFLSGHLETGVAYSENTIVENTIISNWMGLESYLQADNRIHHNNFINNTLPSSLTGSMNIWDNGYPSGGNYWSDYTGNDTRSGPYQNETGSDGIGDTPYVIDGSNQDNYPLMNPWIPPPTHDLAVTTITPSKTIVGQGFPCEIKVSVTNEGVFNETFDLTAYVNTTMIDTFTDITLTDGSSTVITFTWNTTGFARGNYTISANATTVLGETDTSDNIYTDGTVRVNMVGDVAPEYGRVDIVDIVYVAIYFGTEKGGLGYNPNADVNCDGVIDIVDIVINAIHFGETL